jgi:hypothetical protein
VRKRDEEIRREMKSGEKRGRRIKREDERGGERK